MIYNENRRLVLVKNNLCPGLYPECVKIDKFSIPASFPAGILKDFFNWLFTPCFKSLQVTNEKAAFLFYGIMQENYSIGIK